MDERWIKTAIVVAIAVVLYFVLMQVGTRFVNRIGLRGPQAASRSRTLWLMVRRVIVVIIFIFVVLTIFTVWAFSLAPFLALGTVVGAAIGFGAQNVVRDVLAGFFILAEDQYQIGDTVSIGGASGTVEDIQFRVTVLRDFEGNVHYVPNGQITVTSNFTRVFAQPVIDVAIAYDQDVDRAMEVMLEELSRLGDDPSLEPMLRGPAEMLGIQDFGDSGIVIRGRLTSDGHQRAEVRREALLRIKKRFDAEGIRFSAAK
ncbi:MAG: mechanosensitive ion channel family protein [Actinomycetota bacterium]|nr:mechanosensitive ion channel family protein [Actinomycetota bacterium]